MAANTNVAAVATINGTSVPVVVSVANTLRDGTGTITALLTAGANGAIVARVRARHMGAITVASTAMVVRLWVTSGATKVMIDEVALPTATPTVAVIGTAVTFPLGNYTLKAGEILGVTTSISEAVGFVADQGGDY